MPGNPTARPSKYPEMALAIHHSASLDASPSSAKPQMGMHRFAQLSNLQLCARYIIAAAPFILVLSTSLHNVPTSTYLKTAVISSWQLQKAACGHLGVQLKPSSFLHAFGQAGACKQIII